MHETKLADFNPLNLLATAASLQRINTLETSLHDSGEIIVVDSDDDDDDDDNNEVVNFVDVISEVVLNKISDPQSNHINHRSDHINHQSDHINTSSDCEVDVVGCESDTDAYAVNGNTNIGSLSAPTVNTNIGSIPEAENLQKCRMVIKSDLNKMLEEHNYGHSKKNFQYIEYDEPFNIAQQRRELEKLSRLNDVDIESEDERLRNHHIPGRNESCDFDTDGDDSDVDVDGSVDENANRSSKCAEQNANCLHVNGVNFPSSDDIDKSPTETRDCVTMGVVSNCQTSDELAQEAELSCPCDNDGDTSVVSFNKSVNTSSADLSGESSVLDSSDVDCDMKNVKLETDNCVADSLQSGMNERELCQKLVDNVDDTITKLIDIDSDVNTDVTNSNVKVKSAPKVRNDTAIIKSLLTGKSMVVVNHATATDTRYHPTNGVTSTTQHGMAPSMHHSPEIPRMHHSPELAKELKTPLLIKTLNSPVGILPVMSPGRISDGIQANPLSPVKLQCNNDNKTLLTSPPITPTTLTPSPAVNIADVANLLPDVRKNAAPFIKSENVSPPVLPSTSSSPDLYNGFPFYPIDPSRMNITPTKRPNYPHLQQLVISPHSGKYKIGTFASFSNSSLEISPNDPARQNVLKKLVICAVNPAVSGNHGNTVVTCKGDNPVEKHVAGVNPPTAVPTNHIQHDHDYCCNNIGVSLLDAARRISDFRLGLPPRLGRPRKHPERKQTAHRKEIHQASLAAEPFPMSPGPTPNEFLSQFIQEDSIPIVQKPKITHEKVDPGTKELEDLAAATQEAKVKITGRFQDDFVYFVNKTSRTSRRRRDMPAVPKLAPGIVLMPPTLPADIYIPHLSDADIAALKTSPTNTLSKIYKSHSMPDFSKSANSKPPTGVPITDEDSQVINTILSMETPSSSPHDTTDNSFFSALSAPSSDDLSGIDLTVEQMDMLMNMIDKVQSDETPTTRSTPAADWSETSDISPSDPDTTVPQSSESSPGEEKDVKFFLPDSDSEDKDGTKSRIPSTSDSVVTDSSIESNLIQPDLTLPSTSTADTAEKSDVFAEPVSEAKETDYNSPWIVTVTMYWNDLPAIMINHQPYVRLVDIHKQILPAKDTGILKKRCQLLSLEVKNCTEMQRYFVVKYGRGFNSKSTLIITKASAIKLIAFYVEPQPKVSKLDHVQTFHVKSEPVDRVVPPVATEVIQEVSSPQRTEEKSATLQKAVSVDTGLEVTVKQEPKIPAVRSCERLLTKPAKPPIIAEPTSRGLRHKKINFLSMLRGETDNDGPDAAETADTQPVYEPSESRTSRKRSHSSTSSRDSSISPDLSHQTKQRKGSRDSARSNSFNGKTKLKQTPIIVDKKIAEKILKNKRNKKFVGIATSQDVINRELVECDISARDRHSSCENIDEDNSPDRVNSRVALNHNVHPFDSSLVRSSSRKRKIKQLYPIENYMSYSKGTVLSSSPDVRLDGSVEESPDPHCSMSNRADPDRTLVNGGAVSGARPSNYTSTCAIEANRAGNAVPQSVITLSNGPEFNSFTALEDNFA